MIAAFPWRGDGGGRVDIESRAGACVAEEGYEPTWGGGVSEAPVTFIGAADGELLSAERQRAGTPRVALLLTESSGRCVDSLYASTASD